MAAMAAVKSKVQDSFSNKGKDVNYVPKPEPLSFRFWEFCLSFATVCTFIVDFSTDIVLVILYFHNERIYWAVSTLTFIVVPSVIIQVFSIRWYITEDDVNKFHWISHVFLLGLFYRHITVLKTGFRAWSSGDPVDIEYLYHQQNDLCILHLFDSFLHSTPQLLLQLYIIVNFEDWQSWTGAVEATSAAVSLVSVAWALAAYSQSQRLLARPGRRCATFCDGDSCSSSAGAWPLQALWRGGMLAARLAALLLLAVAAGAWFFLLLGIHWISMTIWIILQKTEFSCSSVLWEERLYNCVVGMIYCFCFFNLKEGPSRRKILIFYCVTIAQNLGCLGLFITISGHSRPMLAQVGACIIMGGTILGLMSMLLYYRYFHPAGPLSIGVAPSSQLVSGPVSETAINSVPLGDVSTGKFRSLKQRCPTSNISSQRLNNASQEDPSTVDDACMDKKLLLNHWASYATTTPSECMKSDQEVLNVKEDGIVTGENISLHQDSDNIRKQKRRGICSSEALELELEDSKNINVLDHKDKILECEDRYKRRGICSIEPELEADLDRTLTNIDVDSSVVSSSAEIDNSEEVRRQKRRGILSSSDLCLELEQEAKHMGSCEKENHIVVDLEPVCERKENTFSNHDFKCDLIKRSSDLEADDLKSTDSRLVANEEATSEVLSAPSEVLSAHDYENICAVNIAREAWGLRSWRGYSDIETWLHDDSVVRDRRRDTLTSTVTTITSASSEQSATSGDRAVTPPPLPSRRPRTTRSRQDDYLDTLTEDLAACERPLAEFNAEIEVDSSVYMARPYIVDQHGIFFPLTTLDTIMEEIEETSTDTSDSVRYWQKHGSASTLVATIDEIRRGNSICNLYNSTDLLWDPCGNPSLNMLNQQSESLGENSDHMSFENLYTRESFTRLSPEEVLFLSKLRPPDSDVSSISEQSPCRRIDRSSVDVNLCPLYHNDVVVESQFEDTLPLAHKNNFGIKKLGNKTHQKRLFQEKFEFLQNDNLKFKTDKLSPLTTSTDNIDVEANTQVLAGSTEALVPVSDSNEVGVIHRIHQWNNFLKSQSSCNNSADTNKINTSSRTNDNQNNSCKSNVSSLKERRTLFLKQVLSPPRFQHWSKKGASSIGSVQLRAS